MRRQLINTGQAYTDADIPVRRERFPRTPMQIACLTVGLFLVPILLALLWEAPLTPSAPSGPPQRLTMVDQPLPADRAAMCATYGDLMAQVAGMRDYGVSLAVVQAQIEAGGLFRALPPAQATGLLQGIEQIYATPQATPQMVRQVWLRTCQ
jgi:hypothetical protein